jgi:DNA-binding MarR family transcriptional regulator
MTRQGALLNVQVLERMGYVTLVDDPEDLRAKRVELIPAGKAKLEDMSSFQAAWVNRMATKFRKADIELALVVIEQLRTESLASIAKLKSLDPSASA